MQPILIALQLSEGKPIACQNPLAALLDALQPAIVEEVIYRFALWDLLWLAMRRFDPIPPLPWAAVSKAAQSIFCLDRIDCQRLACPPSPVRARRILFR